MQDLNKFFSDHEKDLQEVNKQRRRWLYASSIVFLGIVLLIFSWDWLDQFHSKSIWWVIVSLMLIVSVNWWYWTMRVVSRLVHHQKIEFSLIIELVKDIREIKSDVKELGRQELEEHKKLGSQTLDKDN